MDYIVADAEAILSFLVSYFSSLGQTSLFMHGSLIIIGAIILYMVSYRMHVLIMLNYGVTWIWLLQGLYLVLIVGGVSGIPYNWARFEAGLPNIGQSTFLIFLVAPLFIGIWLLYAANHARRSTKIERPHQRGRTDTPI